LPGAEAVAVAAAELKAKECFRTQVDVVFAVPGYMPRREVPVALFRALLE